MRRKRQYTTLPTYVEASGRASGSPLLARACVSGGRGCGPDRPAAYSWMTTGVPTVAKFQNQAASAVVMPMQPWLPGIPKVAGRRQ